MTDVIEEIEEEIEAPTLEEDIKSAISELEEPEKEASDDEAEEIEEVETPKKEIKEELAEKPEEEVAEEVKEVVETIPAPSSLTGAIKEKWNSFDEDVKAEWKKREDDIHKTMTRHDGELNLGRKIKEAVTPYMHVIQAEGGTVEGAFNDYLNSAYVLRTGTPMQKTQLVQTIAKQFGVDLQQAAQPQQRQDPNMVYMQQKIQELEKLANPETIRSQLQEDMNRDSMQNEINSFAADPANKHFETVRTVMGSLMETGQAETMQEAYDMACYANPNIRSTLLAAQTADLEEKRKKEIASKRAAAVSVNGSPDSTSPRARTSKKSLEDDLREQMLASQGRL